MSENDFIQMASEFKEIYEKKDKETKKLKKDNQELKKIIVTCYGYIRMLDILLNNNIFLQEPFEMLRCYLSNWMDEEIWKTEEDEDEDLNNINVSNIPNN